MNYSELLKDPRWQKKRLEIMQRDGFACALCMDEKSTLHVHHKKYINGRAPWEYEDKFLITLCDSCHEKQHGKNKAETPPRNIDLVDPINLPPWGELPSARPQVQDAYEKLKGSLTWGMVRESIATNDGYLYVKYKDDYNRHRIKIESISKNNSVELRYDGVCMCYDYLSSELILATRNL